MENDWTKRIEELEAEVAKLTAERDADRRREHGYSQQTVDALTAERDSLKHLYDKALGDLVKDSQRISELEAENTRLRMLRDAAESRAQGLEAQVAKWKAISPANAMAWQERAENAEAQVAALTAEKDMLRERVKELEAANRRLREALDGIITVAKIICNEIPVGTASLYGWVLIGEQALKEASHEGAIQRSPVE